MPLFQVTNPLKLWPIPERTEGELQEFLLFCVAVAGKNAVTMKACLEQFWSDIHERFSDLGALTQRFRQQNPFGVLRWLTQEEIQRHMKEAGIGCHRTKSKAFDGLAGSSIDLKTATTIELERIHGIGLKTSRFFIVYSRPHAGVACLDMHILKWLEQKGVKNVPGSTPSSLVEYIRLENEFLLRVPNRMAVAEFDLKIWKQMSGRSKDNDE